MNEQQQTMQAVYDMRQAQKDYFHQPNKYRLGISKNAEAKVDAILQQYVNAGMVKSKEKVQDNQPLLFP
jgi:hypothetical protein